MNRYLATGLAPALVPWYQQNKRDLPWRHTKDPYCIWLSEVMLQQTRVEAVIPYYHRFLATCPTVQHLAQAEEATFLKLWEGLGYYSRVRNLHKAAQQVCEQHGGNLPADFSALRSLAGVGDYTAGAVGSIAFGLHVPAVDGNVLRVFARLTNDSRPIDDPKVKRDMTATVIETLPHGSEGDFNQALMELGATICIPNGAPRCAQCPLLNLCESQMLGTQHTLPVRLPKRARTQQQRTVLVMAHENTYGIRQRPSKGLLARLWELPSYEGHLDANALRTQLAQDGYQVADIKSLRPAKHIFTHIEWHMQGYYVHLAQPDDRLTWATAMQLEDTYALPSAFGAYAPNSQQPSRKPNITP